MSPTPRLVAACLIALALVVPTLAPDTRAEEPTLEERAQIEGYLRLLSDADADVRRRAADALVAIGAPARPFVEGALEDPRAAVRTAARSVLDRIATAASAAARTDLAWAGLRGGPERSGVAGGTIPAAPVRRWAVPVPGMQLSEGALVPSGERVICLSADGVVRAFDARDGARQWLIQLDTPVTASAVLAGERLVIPTAQALIALDAGTGRRIWTAPARYGCDAAPAIDGGRVFCAFRSEGVRAFDLVSGEQVFEKRCAPSGALLVDDGLVVVGTEDAELRRIDPADGTVLWTRDIGSRPDMGPTLGAPGVIIVLAESRYLRGIAAADGRVLWQRRLKYSSRAESLAAAAGRVLVADSHGALRVFDAATGRALWNRHEGMLEMGGPCVTARRVTWADNGVIACRDAQSGVLQWRLRLRALECAPPAVANGRLFVLTDEHLIAYDDEP